MEPYQGRALIEHPHYGRSVVTTEPLFEGNAAITEKPLLYAHKLYKCKQAASLLRLLPRTIISENAAIALAEITQALCFLNASAKARNTLTAHCAVPDPHQLANQRAVRVMHAVAACVHAATHAVTEQEVFQALLAMYINAHHFGGGGAVFAWGSKLAHVCGVPNTR